MATNTWSVNGTGTWDSSGCVFALLPQSLKNGENPASFNTGVMPVWSAGNDASAVLHGGATYNNGEILLDGTGQYLTTTINPVGWTEFTVIFRGAPYYETSFYQDYNLLMCSNTGNSDVNLTAVASTNGDPTMPFTFTTNISQRDPAKSRNLFGIDPLYDAVTEPQRTDWFMAYSWSTQKNDTFVINGNECSTTDTLPFDLTSLMIFSDDGFDSVPNIGAFTINIGGHPAAISPTWYKGKITQIIIYNRKLSVSEINAIYALGLDLGLKGYTHNSKLDLYNSWSNASNWSLSHKPQVGEDIVFDGTGTGNCIVDENTAQLKTLTITNANAANFNDGGFNIDVDSGFSITIANLITVTMNGLLTMHGAGDILITGNLAGDHSDGYFVGTPSIKHLDSGNISLTWYYLIESMEAVDCTLIDCAYAGKTTAITLYGALYGFRTHGGTVDFSGNVVVVFMFDNNSNFIIDWDPTTTVSNTGTDFYIVQKNTLPRTLDFPEFIAPAITLQFTNGFFFVSPNTATVTVNFNGALDCDGLALYGNFPMEVPWYFNSNNYPITVHDHFCTALNAPSNGEFHFGSSTVTVYGQLYDSATAKIILYLEQSSWALYGNIEYQWQNALWGLVAAQVVPGTSTVRIIPGQDSRLHVPTSRFYNLFVEAAPGFLSSITSGNLIIENILKWYDASSFTWVPSSNGVSLTGSDMTVQLDSYMHGRLLTKSAGQKITWDDRSGSFYTLDSLSIGDLGAYPQVVWKSANPGTRYGIQFPVDSTIGGLNLTDCSSLTNITTVTRGSSTDGGNDAGFNWVSASIFTAPSVSDSTQATSTINKDVLVSLIQQQHPDTYFDTTAEIETVRVYYYDASSRQNQSTLFTGDPLTGYFTWNPGAVDGTWYKSKVVVYGADNAKVTLINVGMETLTHASGTMTLNEV